MHALVDVAKVLAAVGFVTVVIVGTWWAFPRSTAKVKGAALGYPGGFTSRFWNGTRGTARLELTDDTVAVLGRGPFRPLLRWQAGYSDITTARAARSFRTGSGVLLILKEGGWIGFWNPRWAEILDLLELRGVPVDRTVTKFKYWDLA